MREEGDDEGREGYANRGVRDLAGKGGENGG